jgi:2C-methyl-D-erythritol 2,4-cyclodiphosphate synthase
MSTKTKRRLSRFADGLEAVANVIISAIELVLIDAVFGKSKYRKRGAKMRPIIHRTYNRTIVVRSSVPSERLHITK